jgi:hypothetical protein
MSDNLVERLRNHEDAECNLFRLAADLIEALETELAVCKEILDHLGFEMKGQK